ncbi:MAG: ATP-binding cassette domain-containing protein [Bacteroidales bacterium]
MLEIDSVRKSFGTHDVLTDIYLKCETGDIIGMLGRNGSGKSTLLKILFGTLEAENKFIRLNDKIYDKPYKTMDRICYLPQNNFLPAHLKVGKAVELYMGKERLSDFRAEEVLTKIWDNKIAETSGGELRYLEIKLLLSLDAEFVLLDEPFNGVSPLLIENIKELIRKNSKSKGIILTDHDYRNVLDIANRFCLIYEGAIKEIKDKKELVRWGYLPESKRD